MAKKEVSIYTNQKLDATPVEPVSKSFNKEILFERIDSGVNQAFKVDNIPSTWEEIHNEVSYLEGLNVRVEIALASRLVAIRDNELYRKGGFENMVDYANSLRISKTKAYKLMDIFDEYQNFFPHTGKVKIENLAISLPVVKENEDKKEEIYKASQRLGRKDFLVYLNSYKIEDKENESEEEENIHFYNSEEELINNSKFVRAGMKAKTVKSILKDMTNWFLIHEPKNKKIKKIIEALKEL